MPSTATEHSHWSIDRRGSDRLCPGGGDQVAEYGIERCQQAFLGQGERVEADGQRADVGYDGDVLHRRVLAQQDFQDVAAFSLLDERRCNDPDAA